MRQLTDINNRMTGHNPQFDADKSELVDAVREAPDIDDDSNLKRVERGHILAYIKLLRF